jgi:hypothetical protein
MNPGLADSSFSYGSSSSLNEACVLEVVGPFGLERTVMSPRGSHNKRH